MSRLPLQIERQRQTKGKRRQRAREKEKEEGRAHGEMGFVCVWRQRERRRTRTRNKNREHEETINENYCAIKSTSFLRKIRRKLYTQTATHMDARASSAQVYDAHARGATIAIS